MTARTDAEIQARDDLLADVDKLVASVVGNRSDYTLNRYMALKRDILDAIDKHAPRESQ